jgi:hypothetical protein
MMLLEDCLFSIRRSARVMILKITVLTFRNKLL